MATVTRGCINSQNVPGTCDILAGEGRSGHGSKEQGFLPIPFLCLLPPNLKWPPSWRGSGCPALPWANEYAKAARKCVHIYTFCPPRSIYMRRPLPFAPFICREGEG